MLINRKPVQKGGIAEKCNFSPLLWRWPLKPLKQHLTQQMVAEYLMFFQLFTHAVNLLHSHPALRTPNWVITDSLLCPWGKKALTFSLNSTLLIRTLSMAPLSVRTNWVWLRWPTTVTAKPKSSRQKQDIILHGKTENLTAKTKNTSRQNRKPQKTMQKPHGKTKNLTAKTKKPHGKTKDLTANSKYFTAKTKYLTAKANTHGKTKAILFLLWSICFCREVFGFAVTVLGHVTVFDCDCTKLKTLFFHNFNQPKVHWLRRNVGYSRVQALPWTCQLWRRQLAPLLDFCFIYHFTSAFSINVLSSSAFLHF